MIWSGWDELTLTTFAAGIISVVGITLTSSIATEASIAVGTEVVQLLTTSRSEIAITAATVPVRRASVGILVRVAPYQEKSASSQEVLSGTLRSKQAYMSICLEWKTTRRLSP